MLIASGLVNRQPLPANNSTMAGSLIVVASSNSSPTRFGASTNFKNSSDLLQRYFSPRHSMSLRSLVFQFATDIKDAKTRGKFERNGWRFRAPHDLSANYRLYRDYIRRSKGEFTVAKDQYVRLNTGWFSDRSGCYLAAGRPVITQETGFSKIFGGGRHGLIGFQSLGEIPKAVKSINADYTRHSLAAREIAREFFEAEKVLRSLLERAGI